MLVSVFLLAACSDDGRPVNIPEVAPGAYEADCQRLCTLAASGGGCTSTHEEVCLASCRVRTNGLPTACAQCLIDNGEVIHPEPDVFGDPGCAVGGPSRMSVCISACDDGGGPPSPDLAAQCEIACGIYTEYDHVFACSAEDSAACRTACATTIAAESRVCAQCVIEGILFSTECAGDNCDCQPDYGGDPSSCPGLCDDVPPV